jgi:hypothetical protein
MNAAQKTGWGFAIAAGLVVTGFAGSMAPGSVKAAGVAVPDEVTYSKDIAPILQRSCENCHRTDGVAPMSLSNYEEVRPWARAIKQRTGVGPRAGLMPPWYMEKNIGIQHFKDDPSLSELEIAKIAKWADTGATRGNPADMPPAKHFDDNSVWHIGTPDLVVKTTDLVVKAGAPDWWGEIPGADRLDRRPLRHRARGQGSQRRRQLRRQRPPTVGGRFVYHHMIWATRVLKDGDDTAGFDPSGADDSTGWPVHEVGRNADFFDIRAARLLRAGSSVVSDSVHLHSNGRDTKAHLEIGFKFAPKGYKPEFKRASYSLGNGVDIDIRPMEANQQLHAYAVLNENVMIESFEPHLHAPGMRMCLEAIWGYNIQTLNCVGYDHNWVRGYHYADDYSPLLPKGTILHIIGYMDNSPSNKNIPDPRNWQGSGNRSVANMFIDLGNRVSMTDEQFQAEMAKRRERLHLTRNDVVIGCPLCLITQPAAPQTTQQQQQQQQ